MIDVITPALSSLNAAGAVGAVSQSPPLDASRRFSTAMSSALETASSSKPQVSGEVSKAANLDAAERASRSVNPEPGPTLAASSGGDGILNGLQKLRGIFDKQQMRVNTVMSGSINDMSTLLKVQMELVNYSVLIDMTSKLTGKSTQTFETLMKG